MPDYDQKKQQLAKEIERVQALIDESDARHKGSAANANSNIQYNGNVAVVKFDDASGSEVQIEEEKKPAIIFDQDSAEAVVAKGFESATELDGNYQTETEAY